jgi:hypothetical protein
MAAILYENIIRDFTVLTDESADSINNSHDGRTSTSTSFATGATRSIVVDCTSARTVNCLAFGRNNAGSTSTTITVQGSTDNASYSTLFTKDPTDDRVKFYIQSNYSYRYYKIQISGHSNTVYFADLALGEYLSLERDQKAGFISPLYADSDRVVNNITRGQNLVGISIKEGLKRVKLSLPYYTSSWFSDWEALITVLKAFPIYLHWKADNSDQAFYCWIRDKFPEPKYSKNVSGYAYLDVDLDLEGIIE